MAEKSRSSTPGIAVVVLVVAVAAGAAYWFTRGHDAGELTMLEPQPEVLPLEGTDLPPVEVKVDPEVLLRLNPPHPEYQEAPPPPNRAETSEQNAQTDEQVLRNVTHRWVYVAYGNIAGKKQGGVRYNLGKREQFNVEEGGVYEGVRVVSLDDSKMICAYGTARDSLPLIKSYDVDLAVMVDPMSVPWDPNRQEEAKKRYWELYGKRFQQESLNYVPAEGEHMPPNRMPTEEETKQAVEKYLDHVMDYMSKARNADPNMTVSREDMKQRLYKHLGYETGDASGDGVGQATGMLRIVGPGGARQ